MGTSKKLRQMLELNSLIVAPGAYDGLSARLVERAGFPTVYASGGAISRSAALPDLGLLTMSEVIAQVRRIVDAVKVPVIADADTGYGNALNTQRAVREFERAGVAGVHLEDQQFPKRCGHYGDKSLVSPREMQQKLRAARDACVDPEFVIIARTDGLAVEGFERTVERAHSYMESGADVIFMEAPTTVEEIEKIASELPYPKLINMFDGGKTPLLPVSRLQELGFRIAVIPSDTQRGAIAGMERVLQEIQDCGHSGGIRHQLASFSDREAIIGTPAYIAAGRRFAE